MASAVTNFVSSEDLNLAGPRASLTAAPVIDLRDAARLPRTLVIMPTYQEAGNIETALLDMRASFDDVDVLVVDDSSPDGTGEIARTVGERIGRVHVMTRPSKSGLGSAYRDGLRWGLEHDYEALVNMDADGSHDSAALGALLRPIVDGADLVLGSRYCPGGQIPAWTWSRRLLSRWGNRYATALLDLRVVDATAGYRAYRADWLRTFDLGAAEAQGYGVHVEMTYRCSRAGARLVEVPISFRDRAAGESKMSAKIVAETFRLVTSWGVRDRLSALKHPATR